MKTKEEKIYNRHKRIWAFCRFLLKPFFVAKYKFSFEEAPVIDGPCLVLSNHNNDLDPVLLGMCFKKQMYFVASEHVYRQGFVSKLLFWAFEPIAKIKGSSDTLTVMKAIRMLRSGKNVCIFPEGNRSFNGKTFPIHEATGKLVKTSAANLITFKFTGGYLATPRWGYGVRKGKVHGSVVNVYTKEQLKEMSPLEITEKIRADLNENAYERQKQEMIPFKGKNLAEGIETSVCVCPKCRSIDAITSRKNTVYCKNCGPLTELDTYGFFANSAASFDFKTVEEWDNWQEEFYKSYVTKNVNSSETYLICDESMTAKTVTEDHGETLLGTGTFGITSKGNFTFTDSEGALKFSLTVAEVQDMSIYGKCSLVFTDGSGVHYELRTSDKEIKINARKYISLWTIIKG
ncbi:MAG: 1-acyl-sn-glycerol-3-phosphate acyltransferase [Treponema sp.]|nr:1-acyl-sn-glycerol-3-phosphate acyltransferase [Treponema sp.]